MPRKLRILAVDHNPLLREGLSLLISLQPDMELVAVVASGKEAVRAGPRSFDAELYAAFRLSLNSEVRLRAIGKV